MSLFSIDPPWDDSIDWGPIHAELPSDRIDIPMPRFGRNGLTGGAREAAVRIVNGYEPRFAANRDGWQTGQISPTQGAAEFDRLWAAMVIELRPLGDEGQRAISDRSSGGQFDWRAWYRPSGVGGGPVPDGGVYRPPPDTNWGLLSAAVGGGFLLLKVLKVL